jgi:hypothetical protein
MQGHFFTGEDLPGPEDKEIFKTVKALEKGFEKAEPGELDKLKEWLKIMEELTKKRHVMCVSCGNPYIYVRMNRLVKE